MVVATVALFVMLTGLAVTGAVTVMVSTDGGPAARLPERVHVMTPPLGGTGVQFQPVPLKPVYVTPAGSESDTETLAAALGPRFVTAIVYVSVPPDATGSGESDLVIVKSADAVTAVNTGPVLLFPG